MHNFALMLETFTHWRAVRTLTLALLLAAACGGKDNAVTTEASPDAHEMRMGVMPTLDCLPLLVAHEEGILDSLHADVEIVSYDDGLDCCTDLMEGDIDGCLTDVARAAWMEGKGCQLRRIFATNAYWQLVTNRLSRIGELRQMTDKILAVTRFSAAEMLGDIAVDSAGITPEYVFRVQINNPEVRLWMIMNNEIDAAMLTEPQATAARLGNHQVLMDSRDKDFVAGVTVLREDFITDSLHKELADKLTEAYNIAAEKINRRGVKAYKDIIMRRMGASESTVNALPDLKFCEASAPRPADTRRAAQWLTRSTGQR